MIIRPIAIHLPQFHPIPENDEWWGKGFTEWTNVTKAKPLFKGHYQPHLPADLGFYDLRLPEARQAQADLAREYGIYGFCYYHYWFNGRRILERPFQEIFESGKPDFPFMLCWANENWTRRWDGGDETVLLEQSYSKEDAYNHIKYLINVFKDDRYIKINGKPVFAFYRSTIIPNLSEYLSIFREEAAKENMELYLCRFESFGIGGKEASKEFNAAIEFQPFSYMFGEFINIKSLEYSRNLKERVINKLLKHIGFQEKVKNKIFEYYNRVDYDAYIDFVLKNYKHPTDYRRYPCVTPGWDNTARRKNKSFLFKENNPQKFGEWTSFHKNNFIPYSDEENLVFVNAWNEWAEGNHLEPCRKWGLQFLEAFETNIK